MRVLTLKDTHAVCGSSVLIDSFLQEFIFNEYNNLSTTQTSNLVRDWPDMTVVMIDVFIHEGNTYSSFTYPLFCSIG